MSEIERLLHLFVSLQILFGSRRGGLAPLVVLALLGAGWFAWTVWNSPLRPLEAADRKWDSGETSQRIEAIAEYKSLLRRRDPLDSSRRLLTERNDRARLYRRIIVHHVLFDIDAREAREWSLAAWQENLRDLDFRQDSPAVDEFYRRFVEEIRSKDLKLPSDMNRFDWEKFDRILPGKENTRRSGPTDGHWMLAV